MQSYHGNEYKQTTEMYMLLGKNLHNFRIKWYGSSYVIYSHSVFDIEGLLRLTVRNL